MTILINVTMSSNELQFSIHLDSLLAMVAGAMIVITVLLLSILVICLRHLRQSFESSIVIVDGSANAANYLVNGHVCKIVILQMGHIFVYFHKVHNMQLLSKNNFYASVV